MAEGNHQGSYDPAAATGVLADEFDRLNEQVKLTGTKEIELLRHYGLEDGQRITEVGCGPGYFGALLLEALPSSFVRGIEIDSELAELAGKCWQPYRSRSSVHCGSVYNLDSEFIQSTEVVIARYVFQHLQHPESAATSMFDMLKPGGMAAIIDIDEGLWGCVVPQHELFERLYRKAGRLQAAHGGDRLIGRRLPHLLSGAGFEAPSFQVFSMHSDEVGLPALDFHLNPKRLLPAVTEGLLTLEEYGQAQLAYQEFVADPEAFAIVLGFACFARKLG